MPGPVPNRSDQRVRRNKPEIEIDSVEADGEVLMPDLGLDDPHPLVVDFWGALGESAQNRYYEASDWQYARLVMEFLNRMLKSDKPNSMIFSTVNSMLGDLLVSEGSRRKVRMEIERNNGKPNQDSDIASVSDIFRNRLNA